MKKKMLLITLVFTLLLAFSTTAWCAPGNTLGDAEKKYLMAKSVYQAPSGAVVRDVWLDREPFSLRSQGFSTDAGDYVRIFYLDAADGSYVWERAHEKTQRVRLIKEDRIVLPSNAKTAAGEIAHVELYKVEDKDATTDTLSYALYAVREKARSNVQITEITVRDRFNPGVPGLRQSEQ